LNFTPNCDERCIKILTAIGILYVGIPMTQLDVMLTQAMQTMAVAGGFAALLVLAVTMLVVRRVTKPLTSVTDALTAIANGRDDIRITCDDRADEIGDMARTVAVFKNNALERHRLRDAQSASAVAAAEQRKAELRSFVDAFQTSVGGFIDNVLKSSGEFERVARQLTETGCFRLRGINHD
jgi:methyl-accepting chemotaxis protein